MWADVGVEEDFDGLAQDGTALGASPILELEVPDAIAPGTTVMRDDLHLPIDHVLLGDRVAPGPVGVFASRSREAGHQEGKCVWPLRIKNLDADIEVDGAFFTDGPAQLKKGLADALELRGVQDLTNYLGQSINDRVSGLEGRSVH
jgi:hypothetical protein